MLFNKYQYHQFGINKGVYSQSSLSCNEEGKEFWLNEEMSWVHDKSSFCLHTDEVALERSHHLVESHTRFKKLVSGNKYKVVEPVLPMDVLGIYIMLPAI